MAKAMRKVKAEVIVHEMYDRYVVEDVTCQIRFINAGIGFLFPMKDGEAGTYVREYLAYGKIYPTGVIEKI